MIDLHPQAPARGVDGLAAIGLAAVDLADVAFVNIFLHFQI